MSELRWNPILREWTVTATHRQARTFLPPDDYCPLDPTKPGGFPTEVPAADYDFVVFENRFPSFRPDPAAPAIEGDALEPVAPSKGVCEVVLYTSQHGGTLAEASIPRLRRLIEVWTERYRTLAALDYIDYVYIFENKGKDIGVTLTHPHGQIYAFSFIPPFVNRWLQSAKDYYAETGRSVFMDMLQKELHDEKRIIAQNARFVAFIPFFARFPYEVHIYPKAFRPSLTDLDNAEKWDMAEILKVVMSKYDNLWQISMPYIMLMHQQPTDGKAWPGVQFHFEFLPPLRAKDRLKYLAGCESGAGTFINDTLPEEKAAELRAVAPQLWRLA